MQKPDEQAVEAVKTALLRNDRVLLAGGPGGAYGPQLERDQRFEQLVSTEASRQDRTYIVPRGIGCVLVSNLISIAMTKNIVGQCEHRRIPVYGVFRSSGSVQRAAELARAMVPLPPKVMPPTLATPTNGNGHHTNGHPHPAPKNGLPSDEQLEQEERELMQRQQRLDATLQPADRNVVPASPAMHAAGHVVMEGGDFDLQVTAVRSTFADVRAAIDLAEETAVNLILAAKDGVEAAAQLKQLKAMLGTIR